MLQRVQKIIANAGLCSRRKAEEFITEGRVKVNGSVISIGSSADPDKDDIVVDGRRIAKSKKLYLAFNKPGDCLTTLTDPKGRKTIMSYLRLGERVIPVGRLDFNTEGLLFLTNDGEFANRVMHPRYEVEKTYYVLLDRAFDTEDIKQVKEGIFLEELGITTSPAKLRFAGDNKRAIEITIHEGQNRVVRRMMQALGYVPMRLVRTKIGNVELGRILPGKYRELSYAEVQQFIRNAPKARPEPKESRPVRNFLLERTKKRIREVKLKGKTG
jgi:23S rRNA pseudouridine2605 synthase